MLQPTVLTDATNTMPIAENEIFGPVAVLIPFEDDEEAIAMANAYPYGLSGAVHSSNIERGTLVAHTNSHRDDPCE